MTDNEFLALVSLLEDTDVVIKTEIEKKFRSMGESIIPRLEVMREKNKQPLIKERIIEIIEDIQAEVCIKKMKNWRDVGENDLFEAWFIISQYQYPSIEIDIFRNKINRLVNMIWLEMTYSNSYSDRILAMNRILYNIEKYHSHNQNPAKPETFFMSQLFEKKEGNPFSLSILYLLIARKLELSVSAIVLPNYLALRYDDDKNSFYIDAFNKGTFFNRNNLEEYIRNAGFENNPAYYLPASNRKVIEMLLKSLQESFEHVGNKYRAKTMSALLEIIA